MHLSFPNAEHPDVPLPEEGLTIGGAGGEGVVISGSGLGRDHVRLEFLHRGWWLHVDQAAGGVHVNARPVQALAALRAGDLVCVGNVQIQLCGSPPPPPPAPEATVLDEGADHAHSPVVLRGVCGRHYGRSLMVHDGTRIGGGSGCDVPLDEPALSLCDVEFAVHRDTISLRVHRGERVSVNGIACRSAQLKPGDQIAIEQHRFVVEAPGRQRPSTPAADMDGPGPGAVADPAAGGNPAATVWWLVAAAAILAAAITGLLVYGPPVAT